MFALSSIVASPPADLFRCRDVRIELGVMRMEPTYRSSMMAE